MPVSETSWASGVTSTQKHSAILATRKWCLGTAEKLKDVSEISVIFCSRILERQSQPEKMRAPSRKSISCIVSNLHFFQERICLSHRLHAQDHLPGVHVSMQRLEPFGLGCLGYVLGMSWVCDDPLAIQILGSSRDDTPIRHPLRFGEAQWPVLQSWSNVKAVAGRDSV